MSKYAVIDLETTGFGNTDRVVEIGVVVIDPADGSIIDEFDTMLNPSRDLGATHIHGITATMVESAPTFADVSGALARVLGGNIMVAHNLPFDRRFLVNEFTRAGITIDTGDGLCTLQLSGEKLNAACERRGIMLEHQHRALADARATAQLLLTLDADAGRTPVSFSTDVPPGMPRTLRRDSITHEVMPLVPSRFRVRYPTSDELGMSYLNVLDAYLDDLVLSEDEQVALHDLAATYAITDERRIELHEAYVQALIAAARRDGIVSEAERQLIAAVTSALGVDPGLVPEATAQPKVTSLEGSRICFTGAAVIAGIQMDRGKLEAIAAQYGMQPVASVTKTTCDLLVAADPASTSGKAQKARQYGIPVISVRDFMSQIDALAS